MSHYKQWRAYGRVKPLKHIPHLASARNETKQHVLAKIVKHCGLYKPPSIEECGYDISDPCILWERGSTTAGYGAMNFRGRTGERMHRVVWIAVNGDIPDDKQVNHMCGRRPCCNPRHLYLGTQQENRDDTVAAGDQKRGEDCSNAKLTEFQVRRIRQEYKGRGKGPSHAKLARRYGVSRGQIGRIVKGTRWSHVA